MSVSNAAQRCSPAKPGYGRRYLQACHDLSQRMAEVLAQEQTQREEIRAWEKSQLEIIQVQRDFLLIALDKTFDERRENFRRLFNNLDAALVSDRDDAAAQVADLLRAIMDLAKTSPFKDLKSPTLVVQEFLQSGRVIEL